MTEFSVEVVAEEIGVEVTELGLDEVEDFYVHSELFGDLLETLVYEIMIVDNVQVGAIAFYPSPSSLECCKQRKRLI